MYVVVDVTEYDYGEAWIFPSKEEADDFVDEHTAALERDGEVFPDLRVIAITNSDEYRLVPPRKHARSAIEARTGVPLEDLL